MSAWYGKFQKGGDVYVKGALPHQLFVPWKPEPVGAEAVMMVDADTCILLGVDWAKGKQNMKTKPYRDEFPHTVPMSLRLVEPLFHGGRLHGEDSWFTGVVNAVAHRERKLHFRGDVKTSTRLYPKDNIRQHTPTNHDK